MPITPFHALAFAFLYFKNKQHVDPLVLAVSTTFIGLEPLYYILLGEPLDHRILHGFTLALTLYPILVTLGVYIAERFFTSKLFALYQQIRINPVKVKYPLPNIYLLSLFGSFSHIFLDMLTHDEMSWVLYPFTFGNPFYIGNFSVIVEISLILLVVYSVKCWLTDKPLNLTAEN